MAEGETFVDSDHFQVLKFGENAPGDQFVSIKTEGRMISTLSDGLGSGIKAGVLSSLTAAMTTRFLALDIPVRRAAEIIMNSLPVDKVKGISYATFTAVDVQGGVVKVIEYDNPPYVLVRRGEAVAPEKDFLPLVRKNKRTAPQKPAVLSLSSFTAEAGDRLVFFSDGVTQAGMGTPALPFGWGIDAVKAFILAETAQWPETSARDLARAVVQGAIERDARKPKDDISCGVVYFRQPRSLLVLTGPPVNPDSDRELARIFASFRGSKVISGGTTANIISRELGTPVKVLLRNVDPAVPPMSVMEGADLVTEGVITLAATTALLEAPRSIDPLRQNAAARLRDLFLNSDRVTFVVGTKINQSHQDPNMNGEMDIRRNVVKRIAAVLETKYLKDVEITYI